MPTTAPSRETLVQLAQQLPASAQVLAQLGELLTDVNSGLDDVAVLLKRDSALTARVIRISNSVAYGSGGQVAAVEEAVNRVGYAEIYRLVGLATAAQLADQSLMYYGITGLQLRDNTLLTALAAEALASKVDLDPRVVYTAGLLRSTGKLVLDRFAKRSPGVELFVHSGKPDLVSWETSSFECTNAEAAEAVLSAWRFPASVVAAVRTHYTTAEHVGPGSLLLHVASAVARDLGAGLSGEHQQWDTSIATLRRLGLTPAALSEAADETRRAFDGVKGSL
jgi:HD-like signal output (HDOD) protein